MSSSPRPSLRWAFWSLLYDPLVRPLAPGRARAIARLPLRGGERLLLAGCGTGLDLELLPPTCRITAVDLSPAMIRRTRRRAARLGLEIETAVMNVEQLEFDDASFDAVLLHLILAIVDDPKAVAAEAARVLRPGGQVSIFDKFLPDGADPSPARRTLNLLTRTIGTDINRRLADTLESSGLELLHDEPSHFRGLFRIALARKRPAEDRLC